MKLIKKIKRIGERKWRIRIRLNTRRKRGRNFETHSNKRIRWRKPKGGKIIKQIEGIENWIIIR